MFYLALFGCYFCNYFVIVFFNTALVSCALQRFDGQDPGALYRYATGGRVPEAFDPEVLARAFLPK